jgi:hypothetical protein
MIAVPAMARRADLRQCGDPRLRLALRRDENDMRGSKKANIGAMLQTEGVRDDLALPGAANP